MGEFMLPGDAEFERLVADAGARLLTDRGWMMATAESCTGGWIAKCCTDRAGSSAWFERGFVTYSDAAKEELLGVDSGVLEDGRCGQSRSCPANGSGCTCPGRQ